ncbi:MAG: GGDEF domain-containing protein [Burkholderiales bacterium]|nr:GGDEF domain-containing protein [Burkholderiales bacterium]
MLKTQFSRLWVHSWTRTLSEIGADEIGGLFRARGHTTRLTVPRAAMIVSRVRIVAGILAVLTPLWIVIDMWTLPRDVWQGMVAVRLLTAVAFSAILVALRGMHTMRDAYRALFFLLAVPAAFFLFCYLYIQHFHPDGIVRGFSAGYASLPFVMMGGIAIFPLTLIEGVIFCSLILFVQIVAWLPNLPGIDWPTAFGSFWVLLILAMASVLAGVSQLAFMIVMVREGIHDSLTGCYSRRAGEALVDIQYAWSVRSKAPFAIALVCLDRFQSVNERFGYATGDAALKDIAERLHDSMRMRAGDLLVRWVGDQFLLLMSNATAQQAVNAVGRLLASGLGVQPDGQPYTASIGIAERDTDAADDWWRLIDVAESRAKSARLAGGNRTVGE